MRWCAGNHAFSFLFWGIMLYSYTNTVTHVRCHRFFSFIRSLNQDLILMTNVRFQLGCFFLFFSKARNILVSLVVIPQAFDSTAFLLCHSCVCVCFSPIDVSHFSASIIKPSDKYNRASWTRLNRFLIIFAQNDLCRSFFSFSDVIVRN
jgi:hypothetical protein